MAQRDKEFQIRGGFGFSIYDADFKLDNNGTTTENDDGALSIQFPLELRYELSERWNLGLDMKFGSYVYERDSAEGKSNRFFVFGIAGEYTIVNKDNFRWYTGFGIHTASLVLEEKSDDAIEYKEEEWTYSGGGIRLNTGVLIYLGDVVGLNFNLGLDTHNFKLKEYIKNSNKEDLSKIDAKLKLSGLDGTIGLVLRIPRKSKS
ncbi:MAG: outer membrane beta-barrel protein [Bacteroidetes bacterium]|nr:outer membrane beta-barrel protein [Bacteroidota bacterium]